LTFFSSSAISSRARITSGCLSVKPRASDSESSSLSSSSRRTGLASSLPPPIAFAVASWLSKNCLSPVASS
jgi:hypothetical protein